MQLRAQPPRLLAELVGMRTQPPLLLALRSSADPNARLTAPAAPNALGLGRCEPAVVGHFQGKAAHIVVALACGVGGVGGVRGVRVTQVGLQQ